MAQGLILDSTLTDIADAIRGKTGESGAMLPGEMAAKIRSISGVTGERLMTQGQVSDTIRYMTADFDSGVDPSQYDWITADLYRDGQKVGIGAVGTAGLPLTFYIKGGSYTYTMRLTETSIACTYYSGDYVNLYVDVTGYKT